jgi:hypothetical protein
VIRTYDRAKGPDTDGLQDPRAKEVREREKDTDLARVEDRENRDNTMYQAAEHRVSRVYALHRHVLSS